MSTDDQPLISSHNDRKAGVRVEEAEANGYPPTSTGSSFTQTCFHGVNALSGTGLLSIPFALAAGGWLSFLLLLLVALTTFYSALLMQKCMDMDSTIKTYPDIGHRGFGQKGRTIVSIFMNLELYLVATGFLILEGDNLMNLFPEVGLEFSILKLGSRDIFVLLNALIILPSVCLDNLRALSYVSATGALASVMVVCLVLWVGVFDGVGFENRGVIFNPHGLPTAVSLYAFCYCAHPIFPTLYTSMKSKRQFSNVLLVCFTLCTIVYASMAVFGYMMFGSRAVSQITLNLPKEKLSSKIAIYTTLVNPIAKYALMLTPIKNSIKSSFPVVNSRRFLGTSVNILLVASTVVVALCLPFFGYLMSLVGAFFSVTASIILPCLCYAKMSGNYRRLRVETMIVMSAVLIGGVVVITGTYTSVKKIVTRLSNG